MGFRWTVVCRGCFLVGGRDKKWGGWTVVSRCSGWTVLGRVCRWTVVAGVVSSVGGQGLLVDSGLKGFLAGIGRLFGVW